MRAVVKTILGSELRRLIVTLVNAIGKRDLIEVTFKGTRAYTDGRKIVLPAIRDLAEIKYETARALIGYAIHEVAHIRYTDFDQVTRSYEAGKLVKKFQNCIEDYRIEREMTKAFAGAASDLTALRIAIHPKLKNLTTGWLADPRACGPLALTWTGSRLNGFPNPHMQPTLDAIAQPVMALILNWTARMRDVETTEEAVDLAIAFTDEAHAYAARSQLPDAVKPTQAPKTEEKPEPAQTPPASTSNPDDTDPDSEDDRAGDTQDEPAEDETGDAADEPQSDGGSDESKDQPADADPSEGSAAQDQPSSDEDQNEDEDAPGSPDDDAAAEGQEDSQEPAEAAGDPDEASDRSSSDASNPSEAPDSKPSDAPGQTPPTPSKDGQGDPLDFGSSKSGDPSGAGSTGSRPDNAKVDMNDGLLDEYEDGSAQQPSEDGNAPGQGSKKPDASGDSSRDGQESAPDEDAGEHGFSEDDPDQCDGPTQGPAFDDPDDASGPSVPKSEDDDPFADVLDKNARIDDLLDDLAEQIAENGPLPVDPPEADDGEVDPSQVLGDLGAANKAAPNYTSNANTSSKNAASGPEASDHHYDDRRFSVVAEADNAAEVYAMLKAKAAGAISTTARVTRRLLLAEEQKGVLRNRRDGVFDIRNMSAIIQGSGNCYKKPWARPARKTLLVYLGDFSGSMSMSWKLMSMRDADIDADAPKPPRPIELAMMSGLALEQATQGTSVTTAIYGFTGSSPVVNLSIFKEGRQSRVTTLRRIGSFGSVTMDCTPTGEAMAAIAQRMDESDEERKILVVGTDGSADRPELCAQVAAVLQRRGIEVVALGIQSDAVATWAPVYHVINDISELPKALLATIDPRAAKRSRRIAA